MRLVTIAAVIGLAAVSLSACHPAPKPADASAAAGPTAADAKAFLSGIYGHYATGPSNFSPAFKNQDDYFDPDMIALMDEDQKLAQGEVGALDGDPICDCQDFGKLSAVVTVDSTTADEAKATVIVAETDPNFAADDRKPRTFTYDLKAVDGQWRIHDIASPDTPSLRQLFITSNKELAADAASSSAS